MQQSRVQVFIKKEFVELIERQAREEYSTLSSQCRKYIMDGLVRDGLIRFNDEECEWEIVK